VCNSGPTQDLYIMYNSGLEHDVYHSGSILQDEYISGSIKDVCNSVCIQDLYIMYNSGLEHDKYHSGSILQDEYNSGSELYSSELYSGCIQDVYIELYSSELYSGCIHIVYNSGLEHDVYHPGSILQDVCISGSSLCKTCIIQARNMTCNSSSIQDVYNSGSIVYTTCIIQARNKTCIIQVLYKTFIIQARNMTCIIQALYKTCIIQALYYVLDVYNVKDYSGPLPQPPSVDTSAVCNHTTLCIPELPYLNIITNKCKFCINIIVIKQTLFIILLHTLLGLHQTIRVKETLKVFPTSENFHDIGLFARRRILITIGY